MVRAPSSIQAAQGFDVTLTCVRRVTHGGGKQRSTSESVLWQDVQRVQGQPFRAPARMETHIPVAFRISGDAPSTDDSNSANRVVWRLQVSADVPGVNYESCFDVPVFRTPASEQPLSPEETRLTEAADVGRISAAGRLAHSGDRDHARHRDPVSGCPQPRRRGQRDGVFGALARRPGASDILRCAADFSHRHRALRPLFPYRGTGPVAAGITRDSQCRSVSWATGYIVPGRERTISACEIADVTAAIGMQAGSSVYYDVVLVRKVGRKAKVGHSIRDKREAEWLAETIKRAIVAMSYEL